LKTGFGSVVVQTRDGVTLRVAIPRVTGGAGRPAMKLDTRWAIRPIVDLRPAAHDRKRSDRAAALPDLDLHQWFADEELELCPSCGERAGLKIGTAESFLCFACGLIQSREGETTIEQLQGRKRGGKPPD